LPIIQEVDITFSQILICITVDMPMAITLAKIVLTGFLSSTAVRLPKTNELLIEKLRSNTEY